MGGNYFRSPKENLSAFYKRKVKITQSFPTLWPHGLYSPWNSPSKNTGVGSHSLLQGIFPTQGLNPGLRHCRRILYQLRLSGKPSVRDRLPKVNNEHVLTSQEVPSCHLLGRILKGEGNGNPLQYSCLENPVDRGGQRATVQRVARSRTRLSN